MKRTIGIAMLVAGLLAGCNQGEKQEAKTEQAPAPQAGMLKDDAAKFSYAIGLDIGQSIQTLEADIDEDALTAGILDRLNNREPKLSPEEARKVQQEFFKKRAEKQAAERKALAEKNKAEGEKFLAENAKREGVHVTDSGLQYEVIKQGDGPKPKATDRVKVHYRGTLLDGTEFDSSYARGEPVVLPLNGVIKGWTEGVQLMNVGSKYKFYLPPELAYGPQGAGKRIGPNATLIFEVELLGIEGKANEGANKGG